VYCANREKGCDWEGNLGELDVHLNQNPGPFVIEPTDVTLFMSCVSIALKIFNGIKFMNMSAHVQGDRTNVSTVKSMIHSMGMFPVITGQSVSFTQFFAQISVMNISLAKTCTNTLPSTVL
jgi:hypothetical protein